ncbi:MAG: hypothetical protein ACKO3W_01150 [bacterium]
MPRNPRQQPLRRGVSSIKVLLAIPSVAMLAWLGAETALVIRAANQAKSAADAIALAAAARFADGFETARLDALTAAAASPGPKGNIVVTIPQSPGGGEDLVFGAWDEASRAFTPNGDGGPAARARVRLGGDSPNGAPGIVLAGLFEIADISLERTSIAVYSPPRHATALHVVGDGSGVLELMDEATGTSRNGISVRSNSAQAVEIDDQSTLTVPILRIAGSLSPTSAEGVAGSIETGSAVANDPFDAVALPTFDPAAAAAISVEDGATTMVAPGVHEALECSSGTIVLQPGIHHFVGSVTLSGSARLELDRAIVHLATGDGIELSDSSTMRGTPATGIGAWSGFAIVTRGFASRWTISGEASIDLAGIVYAPETRLIASGETKVSLDAAILANYRGLESARLELDEKIEELDLPFVAGRARLVR